MPKGQSVIIHDSGIIRQDGLVCRPLGEERVSGTLAMSADGKAYACQPDLPPAPPSTQDILARLNEERGVRMRAERYEVSEADTSCKAPTNSHAYGEGAENISGNVRVTEKGTTCR